jgi:hypothetical protein
LCANELTLLAVDAVIELAILPPMLDATLLVIPRFLADMGKNCSSSSLPPVTSIR